METINGTIESVSCTEGTGKDGKAYKRWLFVIDGKKYSTFDSKIGEAFKTGQKIEMEGQQKGQFWNMETMKEFAGVVKMAQSGSKSQNGTASMYVSYAKDVFCAMWSSKGPETPEIAGQIMNLSIDLVKQAKEAFE